MPLPAGAALLVVDVQQGLDDPRLGARNNPDAERRVAELLAAWRAAAWPVVHVQHLSRSQSADPEAQRRRIGHRRAPGAHAVRDDQRGRIVHRAPAGRIHGQREVEDGPAGPL